MRLNGRWNAICHGLPRQGKIAEDSRGEPHLMGVQSLDEALLDRLDGYTAARWFQVVRHFACALLRQHQIDLMFAIPANDGDLARDVERGDESGSEHLSSYEVIYERTLRCMPR